MKYIKAYKLFESIYMDYDSIDDIRDILSDMSDDGIEVKSNIREDDRIIINIGDDSGSIYLSEHPLRQTVPPIDVLKYEDTLLRAIEYVESKGYRFIVFSYDDRGVMQITRDGEKTTTINGETFPIDLKTLLINNTPPTNYLRLFFKK